MIAAQAFTTIISFFKKNGPTPASFSFIFGLFKQTSLQFLQQIYVEKCPSSIWCRDLNPRPSERESLPFTTRPGLPPYHNHFFILVLILIIYCKRWSWGAWIADWYHTGLWSLVCCTMAWAESLSLGDDKLFFGPKDDIYADSIWFSWFDIIICLSNLSCDLWNRKLKINKKLRIVRNEAEVGIMLRDIQMLPNRSLNRGAQQLMWVEGLYQPNCQTVLCELSLLFSNFIDITAFHLCW